MSSYMEQSSRFRPWGEHMVGGLSAMMPRPLPPDDPREDPRENPNAPAPHMSPPTTHLIKVFIFIVILGVHPKLHILPSFLGGGDWEPQCGGAGGEYVFPEQTSWMPRGALPRGGKGCAQSHIVGEGRVSLGLCLLLLHE